MRSGIAMCKVSSNSALTMSQPLSRQLRIMGRKTREFDLAQWKARGPNKTRSWSSCTCRLWDPESCTTAGCAASGALKNGKGLPCRGTGGYREAIALPVWALFAICCSEACCCCSVHVGTTCIESAFMMSESKVCRNSNQMDTNATLFDLVTR